MDNYVPRCTSRGSGVACTPAPRAEGRLGLWTVDLWMTRRWMIRYRGTRWWGARYRGTRWWGTERPSVGPGTEGRSTFRCPRCAAEVRAAYYGPCEACRDTLRATVAAEARNVEAAAYEPKMNVTPNAVATKD